MIYLFINICNSLGNFLELSLNPHVVYTIHTITPAVLHVLEVSRPIQHENVWILLLKVGRLPPPLFLSPFSQRFHYIWLFLPLLFFFLYLKEKQNETLDQARINNRYYLDTTSVSCFANLSNILA